MKAEYKEGPEARENFERLAKSVFAAPKPERKAEKKRQPKKATASKTTGKKRD